MRPGRAPKLSHRERSARYHHFLSLDRGWNTLTPAQREAWEKAAQEGNRRTAAQGD